MTNYIDQKAADCLQFILEIIGANGSPRAEPSTTTPLFIGMNGAQGAGKTTLVRSVRLHSFSSLPGNASLQNNMQRRQCGHTTIVLFKDCLLHYMGAYRLFV